MPVNTTHSDYDSNLPAWLRVRDVLAGEDAVSGASECAAGARGYRQIGVRNAERGFTSSKHGEAEERERRCHPRGNGLGYPVTKTSGWKETFHGSMPAELVICF